MTECHTGSGGLASGPSCSRYRHSRRVAEPDRVLATALRKRFPLGPRYDGIASPARHQDTERESVR